MGLDNPLHIAFLVVILLLVFGARRLPEIGRSLGSGMREFKDSISGESSTAAKGDQPALTQATQPPPVVPQPPPVAQPAPAQTPAAAQASAPAQPAQVPVADPPAEAPVEPTRQA
jgi:sec-independent protein translocase protein TatA